MVNHPFSNCDEVIDKYSTFLYNINRKIPCKRITPSIAQYALSITPINEQNILLCVEINTQDDKN